MNGSIGQMTELKHKCLKTIAKKTVNKIQSPIEAVPCLEERLYHSLLIATETFLDKLVLSRLRIAAWNAIHANVVLCNYELVGLINELLFYTPNSSYLTSLASTFIADQVDAEGLPAFMSLLVADFIKIRLSETEAVSETNMEKQISKSEALSYMTFEKITRERIKICFGMPTPKEIIDAEGEMNA